MEAMYIGPKTFTEIAIEFAEIIRVRRNCDPDREKSIHDQLITQWGEIYPAINFRGMYNNMTNKLMALMFKRR